MKMKCALIVILFLSIGYLLIPPPSHAKSIYSSLLQTAGGRDSLQNLAAWEDGRVTGRGKLFSYLNSNNPLIRLRAVEVIGRIQDKNDATRLTRMLKDKDEHVVKEAVFALGQIGSKSSVKHFFSKTFG